MKPTTNIFNFVIPEAVRPPSFSSSPILNKPSSVAHSILNNPVTPYQPKLGRVIVVYPMDLNYTAEYSTYNNQMDFQADIATAVDQEETDFSFSDPSNFDLTEIHSRNYTDSSEERMEDENDPSFYPTKTHSQDYTDSSEEIRLQDDDPSIDISSSSKNKALERSTIKTWSKEEDIRLLEKVQNISNEKLHNNNWKIIAQDFPGKTYSQVKLHYHYLKQTNIEGIKKGKWSKSEEKLLKKLILQHSDKPETFTNADWREIASQMKSRNWVQIRNRWTNHSNPILKKSQWTKEENEIIMKKVQKVGKKWTLIAKNLPGRTGIQIKQHYEDTLDSRIRKNPWTEKEDQLLKAGFEIFGKKWQEVARFINQGMGLETIRTRTQCRNHWRIMNRS